MAPTTYGIDLVDPAAGEAAPELGQAQQALEVNTQPVRNGSIQRKAAASGVSSSTPGQPLDPATRTLLDRPNFYVI